MKKQTSEIEFGNTFTCYYRSLLRAAVIIVPLLGVTWVVGILAVNENTVVFAWIFTILNSLQVCNLPNHHLCGKNVLFVL